MINLLFSELILILFTKIQLKTTISSLFKTIDTEGVGKFSNKQYTVLSSANQIILKTMDQLGKLIIINKMRIEPRIEPWEHHSLLSVIQMIYFESLGIVSIS